jgi:phosphoglycerol transferase MdoB-like AlkP superfamily enzyme
MRANDALEIATFIFRRGFLTGVPRTSPLRAIDRQTIAGLIPLAAICIALAEYVFDRTEPRWTSPWFWAALCVTVGLLVVVQVLRFMKSSPPAPSKPDFSATSIIRRKSTRDEGDS